MARDGKYEINYEQSPLIVDMHQKRRERFKWKKTPDPVLSKPRVAAHPPGVKAAAAPSPAVIDARQEPLRAPEPALSIWWPSPTQFKHIEANWAFFLAFIFVCISSGAVMTYQVADAVRGPWEEIGQLISIPLGATLYLLMFAFGLVRALRVFGGPVTTLVQLGRFSSLSAGVRLGMLTGLGGSFFLPSLFGIAGGPVWTIFSTLGTMGLVGGIFGWVENNILGQGNREVGGKRKSGPARDDERSIFDTGFYRETLPLIAAILVALGAAAIIIADRSSGYIIQANQIDIVGVTIDRAFLLLILQAAILAVTFRWTARIVGSRRYFFGYKDLDSLN